MTEQPVPAPYRPYQPEIAPPTNALALTALVLGLITAGLVLLAFVGGRGFWVLSFLPGLLTIIFGFIGINTANRMKGWRRGKAIFGVVLGFSPLWLPFLTSLLFNIPLS